MRVFNRKENSGNDFFYAYCCFFYDMYVRLPLTTFEIDVLKTLNVAPTQLHPNTWRYIQAFAVMWQPYFCISLEQDLSLGEAGFPWVLNLGTLFWNCTPNPLKGLRINFLEWPLLSQVVPFSSTKTILLGCLYIGPKTLLNLPLGQRIKWLLMS